MFGKKRNGDAVSADDDKYYEEARNWETSRMAALERSEVRAWRVAAAAAVMALASVIAVAAMMPLKSSVPFLIEVDQHGEAKVRVAASEQAAQFTDVQDRHWVHEYVLARERYYWNLLQYDYDRTVAFSGDVPLREYIRQFEGAGALHKTMGQDKEYAVRIVSVGLPKHAPGTPGTAVVRFEKTRRGVNGDDAGTTARYVATLSFHYRISPVTSEKDLIMNPLGFTVTAYRLDSELVNVSPTVPAADSGKGGR